MSFHELIMLDSILFTLGLVSSATLTAAPQLDLSIPKDVYTNEKTSFPKQEFPVNPEQQEKYRSPEHAFYVQNANEKILRRLKAVPAQDQFGKQICGKIEYRAIVRPDGSLESVEITPVEQTENYESKVEVYSNPTPSLRDAKEVSRLDQFSSDKEEINIFVTAMNHAIYAAAPFPPYPKHPGDAALASHTQKSQAQFSIIGGTFWRECYGWTQPRKSKPQ